MFCLYAIITYVLVLNLVLRCTSTLLLVQAYHPAARHAHGFVMWLGLLYRTYA